MKIKLVSSSTWHDIFLTPLANELKERNYDTELILGQTDFGDCSNCITILSYQDDIKRVLPSKKIILLEHAVSTVKSAYAHESVSLVDYVLVQGEIFSQWLTVCHPQVKQLKTGWHRIENLYNKPSTKTKIIKRHNLKKDKPIILYLPTWDHPTKPKHCGTFQEAYPLLKELNLDNFLTLPHKSCIYANHTYLDDINIIRNADTYEYLLASDLILGDTSSILMEYTVLDKPIIHLNKWNDLGAFLMWHTSATKNCKNLKNLFGLYQLGDIISLDKNLILETINYNLEHPNKYKHIRNYYKELSFYNLGCSLKASVDAIELVVNGGI